jgi:hypothetical protein
MDIEDIQFLAQKYHISPVVVQQLILFYGEEHLEQIVQNEADFRKTWGGFDEN